MIANYYFVFGFGFYTALWLSRGGLEDATFEDVIKGTLWFFFLWPFGIVLLLIED